MFPSNVPAKTLKSRCISQTKEAVLSSYAVRSLNTAGDRLAGCSISNIEAKVISADSTDTERSTTLSEARAAVVLKR